MRKTKRITIKELAIYFRVHRNTMAQRLRNAGGGEKVNLADPMDVIKFIRFLFKYE
ncbi:MAG: hypothetical protein KCHDKBKB_00695 [Elusimicrobia bacterium]|nr:hypothetical protein [Elusimicrobiota bacterium]